MKDEFIEEETNSEDLDSPGTVFAKYKVGLILFIVMAVILVTVFVLYATKVISLFVTNCIIIPIALIVIIFFAIKTRKG